MGNPPQQLSSRIRPRPSRPLPETQQRNLHLRFQQGTPPAQPEGTSPQGRAEGSADGRGAGGAGAEIGQGEKGERGEGEGQAWEEECEEEGVGEVKRRRENQAIGVVKARIAAWESPIVQQEQRRRHEAHLLHAYNPIRGVRCTAVPKRHIREAIQVQTKHRGQLLRSVRNLQRNDWDLVEVTVQEIGVEVPSW